MNGYVYIRSEPSLWTTGFYDPSGKFDPESDHDSPEAAADRVRYLNGGTDPGARQLRELLAEIIADLKSRNVGHRVEGTMPGGCTSEQYQVHLWAERAGQAGVALPLWAPGASSPS